MSRVLTKMGRYVLIVAFGAACVVVLAMLLLCGVALLPLLLAP